MIVSTIDPTTIATVIEANVNAYLLSFARLPGAIVRGDHDCVRIDSGRPDTTLNSVVSARFSPNTVDARVDTVLASFRAESRCLTWHVGPSTEPSDLGRTLLAHGLTHSEDEPGMAVEIDRMREDVAAPAELTIETVRDERGLEEWVSVWLFPAPEAVRLFVFESMRQRGLGDELPWRFFVGRLGGRPVACSQLCAAAGVAGVQYVVTLPEVRRRGIGAAMTLQVLREARAMGYRVGVLTSSPDGLGIYRRIGFREYCWFHRYEWDGGRADVAIGSAG
jgi:GNAT superfamily N-acetyltransferase